MYVPVCISPPHFTAVNDSRMRFPVRTLITPLCLLLFWLCSLAPAHASNYPEFLVFISSSFYVSGTNSYAGGSWSRNPLYTGPVSHFVAHMTLKIAGEQVADVSDTTRSIYQDGDGLSMTYDSTHFADGQSVPIEFTFTTSDGQTQTGQGSATVYNKAYLVGNQADPDFLETHNYMDAAQAGFEGAHYKVTKSYTADRTAILNALPTYTGFYIYSHGTTGGFSSATGGNGNNPGDLQQYIPYLDVTPVVQGKTTAAPPLPPYNFVFIDTCLTGLTGQMAQAFGVTAGSDRAFLGWETNWTDNSPTNKNWRTHFWDHFKAGYTLQQSVFYANGYTDDGMTQIQGRENWKPDVLKDDHAAVTAIYGDAQMTLGNSVYGAKNRGDWHR